MKDKIIFWIDSHLLFYCLTYYLQKNKNFELYSIIDITDRTKDFFKKQNLVNFKKIWFYHDHINNVGKNFDIEYLKSFEEHYNINLWNLACNERLFYYHNRYYKFSYEEILSILEQECRLFEKILDEINPQFFVTKETALHHHHLFYEMCKKRNVKILMLNHTKIGTRYIISQEMYKLDSPPNFEKILDKKRNFDDLLTHLKSIDNSKQLIDFQNKAAKSKLDKINASIDFFLKSSNTNTKTHYSYFGRSKTRVLFKDSILALKAKYRKSFIDKNLNTKIEENVPFVLFPMHQEPERSLLIATPYYTNQIETIRHIVKSLPVEYKLYVKEHYSQSLREWRPISDYKKIMEIPNVKLFHPKASIDELIKKCSLVITTGGTASFEAAFYKKPSIIFTDMGFNVLPSIFRLKYLEDLPKTIRLALSHEVNPTELDKYVDYVDKNSFYFDLLGFIQKEANFFNYGGNFADTKISENKMKLFLKDNKNILENLAEKFSSKINDTN